MKNEPKNFKKTSKKISKKNESRYIDLGLTIATYRKKEDTLRLNWQK